MKNFLRSTKFFEIVEKLLKNYWKIRKSRWLHDFNQYGFVFPWPFFVKCDRPYRKPRQKRSPIGFVDFLGFGKRTVNFMGMQVSMPQYLRLRALQNKVIKLDKIIKALQARYTDQELELLPQYARLEGQLISECLFNFF